MEGGPEAAWITDEGGFAPLRDEWNALAAASGADSVFLRHEWFDAAWRWLGREGAKMRILCLRAQGALEAVCPLMIVPGNWKGIRHRVLRILEVPDTQAWDVIGRPEGRARALRALLDALRETKGEWDVLELGKIPPASPTLALLPGLLREAGWAWAPAPPNPNYWIRLQGTYDEYNARRSRRLRKSNNLIRNHLQRDYQAIAVERVPAPGQAKGRAAEALAEAVRISGASWKKESGNSLDRPGPNAFIARLTELAAERGWLAIWLLSLEGKAVAMEYQLHFGGDVHALRADFDPEYEQKGPGTYLNMEMLRALIGAGGTRYLMGPGSNAYKLRWMDEAEELGGATVYGPGPRGRLLGFAILRLAAALRRLRPKPREGAAPAAAPAGDAD